MGSYFERVQESVQYIQQQIGKKPEIGIILGSGLGTLVKEIEEANEIPYHKIPHFPQTTVQGHDGMLVSGLISGKQVIAMKGRFHYYEGFDISEVVFAIRVLKLLGINKLIVTNAAGGINTSFHPGDLMLINDHISLFAPSPLRGKNLDEIGTRFPDMSEAYSKSLLDIALKTATELNLQIKTGVYVFAQGPMYETPAEIKLLGLLGADAVGMSTIPEVIVARHAGIEVLGISCITNMAAGILAQPLAHQEVMETAKRVEKKFTDLVSKVIYNIQ